MTVGQVSRMSIEEGGIKTYWEELPEPFHVRLAQCIQKLLDEGSAHAHSGQFLTPQVFCILHACFAIDGALETTCLSKDLLGLCILRVEGRSGRARPAERRETSDHESTKAGECDCSRCCAVGRGRGDVWSAPGACH